MADEITRLETRRDELRRTVYGTADGFLGASADELAEVERRLVEMRGAARADAGGTGAVPSAAPGTAAPSPSPVDETPRAPAGSSRAPVGSSSPDFGDRSAYAVIGEADDADAASARPVDPRRRRRLRLAALVAAPVVALALVAGLAPVRQTLSPPAPHAVFAQSQGEGDRVPEVLLERWPRAVESSFRNIGAVGGFGFWAFSDIDGSVCLAVRRDESSGWSSRCLTPTSFAVRGHLVVVPYARIALDDRPPEMDPHEYLVVRWGASDTEVDWLIANVYQIAEITGESPA